MKKIIGNGIYIVFAFSGAIQFFLVPGLIWNLLFPFVQILLIVMSLRIFQKNKVIKVCSLLIAIILLFEIGFSLNSNFNIRTANLDKGLSIMSYNVFFKNGKKGNSISIIKKSNPDILFVQELTPNWAARIDKTIGNIYKYKLTKSLNGTHGIGIYSKYKIRNQQFLMNSAKKPFAQIVDLIIEDKKIQLINTHLASPAIAVENKKNFLPLFRKNYKVRKSQIIELNNLATNGSQKYDCQLLVGDLNTLHSEPIFKRLRFKWVNSYSGLLRWTKFNFPYSSKIIPIITLDYIFGRGNMEFLESKVLKGGSSDHLAILTKIKI